MATARVWRKTDPDIENCRTSVDMMKLSAADVHYPLGTIRSVRSRIRCEYVCRKRKVGH